MAGGRSCTPGSGVGSSTIYCCSDKDYCNETTRLISPMIMTLVLMVTSLIAKVVILC
jgi:hypothetical protein